MADSSLTDFLTALDNSELLTAAQIASLRKQLTKNSLTADALAAQLVKQQHLTGWQARQLLKGQTGFVLQQYRLLNPIGRGGMGHVFRARGAESDNIVAVKVMARKLTGNETLVSRFRREIRASSKLNSPHIVRTLDAGRVGNVDFMVMEYVNGDQVDRIANHLGRVPVGLSCEIVRQVAIGLQHAFERKMVHRDIKPANLMIHWDGNGAGTAKLMDMGLVLVMSDDVEEKTVTRAGQVMGTPDYMSPEQGWDTATVDIRSDIYSLGCTLFRLLTGKIPFSGSNPLQVLSQRLQRDAPSVRTICDDISEDVAAVVSKMTMRDPEARYQTPAEVAEALASCAEPITQTVLRDAAKLAEVNSTFDDQNQDENEVDESDGTYQQFLKEVQEGSEVDLMLATDPGVSPSAVTAPVLNLNIDAGGSNSTRSRNSKAVPVRARKPGFVVLAGSAVAVLSLLTWAFWPNGDDPNSGKASPQAGTTNSVPAVAKATFTEAKAKSATAGEIWNYTAQAEISEAPTRGSLRFVAGDGVPAGLTVNPESGDVQWDVPDDQPSGDFPIPLRLNHVVDGNSTLVAETQIVVRVKSETIIVTLPDVRKRRLTADPGELFTLSMAADVKDKKSERLTYQMQQPLPSGLTIDADTGLINWTPTALQMGRHDFNVSVHQKGRSAALDRKEITVMVLPRDLVHVLPQIPPQQATAGTLFRFRLPRAALTRNPRIPASRVIVPTGDVPDGFAISARNAEVTWQIPNDVVGTVKLTLEGRIEGPGAPRPLNGQTTLEIQVAAATASNSKPLMPPAEEIKKAIESLTETYGRSISLARSAADKVELANRLLLKSYDAPASATDAALLQLIETDLAVKARATDVLLEISRLRSQRYGTDELKAIETILKTFRKTGLSQVQQDLIIEHGLRLATASISADNYTLTEQLLSMVRLLLNRSAKGPSAELYTDVTVAEGLAKELSKQTPDAIDNLQAEELGRLVDRWQFQPVFTKSSSTVFFQTSSTGAVPGNGQELWKLTDGLVKLKSETQGSAVGVLDTAQEVDRYVLRFLLMPGSNCVQIVIGQSGSGPNDFTAFTVVLNPSALGTIHQVQNPTPLNAGKTGKVDQNFADVANVVEIGVDGPQVGVRLNGVPLSQARIAELKKGRLGIAADLRRPNPQLEIRQPRILLLPGAP